jgi:hypothetical protein
MQRDVRSRRRVAFAKPHLDQRLPAVERQVLLPLGQVRRFYDLRRVCEPILGLVDVRLGTRLLHQRTTRGSTLQPHMPQTVGTSANGSARSCARVFQYKRLTDNPRWQAIATPAAAAMIKITGMR